MKNLLTIAFLLITTITVAQSRYENEMQKAAGLLASQKYTEALNIYERVADVEQDKWLPSYYIAFIKISGSFAMKDKEAAIKRINDAFSDLEFAESISPKNSEIYVMKAFGNLAKISANPAVYGASLSNVTIGLYEQAVQLNQKNPRAICGLIQYQMGAAKYFNQDTTPLCEKLQKAVLLYDEFKLENTLSPNWGKEYTQYVIKNDCGNAGE